jgi:hypothetical protein
MDQDSAPRITEKELDIMAKRPETPRPTTPSPARQAYPTTSATTSTTVRNTAIPKAQAASQPAASSRAVTNDMIAKRAYEISKSPECGSEFDNWIRAERELKGGRR